MISFCQHILSAAEQIAIQTDPVSMMIELYVGLQLDGKSVQMLSPSGKTRRCSVNVLNTLVQGLVNPACSGTLEVPIGNQVYRVGDRIVQMQNNKYAMSMRKWRYRQRQVSMRI